MAEPDRVVYREEVLAMIGALADIVVDVRRIRQLLEDANGQEEEEQEGDQ